MNLYEISVNETSDFKIQNKIGYRDTSKALKRINVYEMNQMTVTTRVRMSNMVAKST